MSRDSDKRMDRIILSRETKKLAVCATVEVSVILREYIPVCRFTYSRSLSGTNLYNQFIFFPYLCFPCRTPFLLPEMAVGYRWE